MKGALLQRLRDDTTQTEIAQQLNVHKSTVNRLVNEHADGLLAICAFVGFRLTDADALVVSKDEFKALKRFAVRGIETLSVEEDAR